MQYNLFEFAWQWQVNAAAVHTVVGRWAMRERERSGGRWYLYAQSIKFYVHLVLDVKLVKSCFQYKLKWILTMRIVCMCTKAKCSCYTHTPRTEKYYEDNVYLFIMVFVTVDIDAHTECVCIQCRKNGVKLFMSSEYWARTRTHTPKQTTSTVLTTFQFPLAPPAALQMS